MQFHLQLHELSDVCVRYRSSFTINYRALFPDECLGKRKAIRSTPVGEWMFLQVQKLSSGHSGSECWAECSDLGLLVAGILFGEELPCLDPLWLPSYLFLWRVLYGLVVRVTQMLLTLQRCRLGLRHASGAWCWTICEVNGDKFEFSQEADANRFLKWTPTPDPIEWHRRRPANTHRLDLFSEANVWCALIVMSGIRCQ